MTLRDRKHIESEVKIHLSCAISSEYLNEIVNEIIQDVIEDVAETSACETEGYFSEDDIRLAIGRVLMKRLGKEI